MTYNDQLYLMHHGVLGMKWGVRRYQNKDGSLTKLGRERLYGDSDSDKFYNKKKIKIERDMSAVSSFQDSKKYESHIITSKHEHITDAAEFLKNQGQVVNDLYNQYQKSLDQDYKNIKNDPKAISELSSFVKSHVDNKSGNISRDDVEDVFLYDNPNLFKYMNNTSKAYSKYRDANDLYFDNAKTLVNDIVGTHGKEIIKSNGESHYYNDLVYNTLMKEAGSGWIAYLSRHDTEYDTQFESYDKIIDEVYKNIKS